MPKNTKPMSPLTKDEVRAMVLNTMQGELEACLAFLAEAEGLAAQCVANDCGHAVSIAAIKDDISLMEETMGELGVWRTSMALRDAEEALAKADAVRTGPEVSTAELASDVENGVGASI